MTHAFLHLKHNISTLLENIMGNRLSEIPKIRLKTFKLEVNVIDLLNEFHMLQLYVSFTLST